jgi:hypothetical protein
MKTPSEVLASREFDLSREAAQVPEVYSRQDTENGTNPHWYRDEYLSSDHWYARRKETLDRADNRCQLCYSPRNMQVHHRTYLRLGDEDPFDLTALCRECHEHFHQRGPRLYRELPPLPEPIVWHWHYRCTAELLSFVFWKDTQREKPHITFRFAASNIDADADQPDWWELNYGSATRVTASFKAPRHANGQPWASSKWRTVIETLRGRPLDKGEVPDLDDLIGSTTRLYVSGNRNGQSCWVDLL